MVGPPVSFDLRVCDKGLRDGCFVSGMFARAGYFLWIFVSCAKLFVIAGCLVHNFLCIFVFAGAGYF